MIMEVFTMFSKKWARLCSIVKREYAIYDKHSIVLVKYIVKLIIDQVYTNVVNVINYSEKINSFLVISPPLTHRYGFPDNLSIVQRYGLMFLENF